MPNKADRKRPIQVKFFVDERELGLEKGEDGAAWDREYERLPSPSGNRRI